MNALPLDSASDPKVLNITDEYLFGSSILVAPVIQPMYTSKTDGKVEENFSRTKSRKIYLPEGADWFDFWTGQKQEGGQEVIKEVPIDIIPLYIKAGTILPWGLDVQYAEEKKWDDLEIRIYPGKNASFTLYEDENDNYNYEKGIYATISFSWNDQDRKITISDRKGSFSGMLKNRKFKLLVVSEKNGIGDGFAAKSKTVSYSGKEMIVRL